MLDNLEVKHGMRIFREFGRLKGREHMRRMARDKDEEMLWQKFWDKGQKCRDLMRWDVAKRLKEKEELQKKEKAEKEKREKELDEMG